jgi:thioredoxin 1
LLHRTDGLLRELKMATNTLTMKSVFAEVEPIREEIDAMRGPVIVEFGTDWCGHCSNARPFIESALDDHPGVIHIKVEDGKGRPLGRSFEVSLWPTLVFLLDGRECGRLVRPTDMAGIARTLLLIDPVY